MNSDQPDVLESPRASHVRCIYLPRLQVLLLLLPDARVRLAESAHTLVHSFHLLDVITVIRLLQVL